MFNATDTPFRYVALNCGALTGEPGYASQCVQCGECLEKCPQKIDIPACLEKVAAELEGPHVAQMEEMAKKIFLKSVNS
jgi:predicted aldo/keto reductase-like oxidoreductase